MKDIKLRKGMARDDVNIKSEKLFLLDDDIYMGNNHRHIWKCKCGNKFERRFADIQQENAYECKLCVDNRHEQRYKHEVEKTGEYEYIRSYRKGDILPNEKKVGDSPYIQIKHKYCGHTYETMTGSFINTKQRCGNCCQVYENSLAYHIEVELGLNIEDIWDFEKNTINPYHTWKSGTKKVWIKCQSEEVNELNGLMKKDYHDSYEITCNKFYSSRGRNYYSSKKIHVYDSFGYHNFDKVMSWHPDNDISPFRVAPNSNKKYKFVCHDCGYEWSSVLYSVNNGHWCRSCSSSKAEKRIYDLLILHNIGFIKEKVFKDLIGVGGGYLRYDFYIPSKNMLIEYNGTQHYIKNKFMMKKNDFDVLQSNDSLKIQYAKEKQINITIIPYWEFDKIEIILSEELNL
ncbi:MAG: zinc-ribbon domain-containing protein [Clostridium sp.]|uniref:zinc-ribbon domain-containing protein n=1 Tax=Clostridium sp. TaxID=1506 RepID=UPI003EE4C18C